MADYKKIIRSPTFTFLVGSEKAPLPIHAAIVRDLSDPLRVLMDNGRMKESIAGVATLDDVEEETFIGFCEYAYTGQCVTPELSMDDNSTDQSSDRSTEKSEEFATEDAGPFPVPTPGEWIVDSWGRRIRIEHGRAYYFVPKEPVAEEPTIVYPYDQLWERFRFLSFNSKPASVSQNPNILFHAKLYVFATKYLIEPLRQQCLKTIHRDLCSFSLNEKSQSLIFDLLDFTYVHTGRDEPGRRSALRDIVIHYVACAIRTLADDQRFTEVLESDAEIGSDLVMKLVS